MKRRATIIGIAAASVAASITVLIIWMMQPSYDDTVRGCQKALAAQSKAGGEGMPSACRDVKEDDYMGLVVGQALDDMPEKDRNLLDYYDDGSINDSIG